MRYQVKTFKAWVNESKTNEGVADFIKGLSKGFMNLLTKFKDLIWKDGKFEGHGSAFLNTYARYKKGELGKGIEIYPTSEVDALVGNSLAETSAVVEEPMAAESTGRQSYEDAILEMDEYIDRLKGLNEAEVTLEHPNLNMVNFNRNGLIEVLERVIESNKLGISKDTGELAIFIWGAPGISKTDLFKQLASKHNMQCMIANLSLQPPDCLMIPAPNEKGRISLQLIDDLPLYDTSASNWKELEDEKNCPVVKGHKFEGGIVFFDELPRADVSNIAPALSLVQDRALSRFEVASDWVFFGAGNRRSDDEDKLFRIKSPAMWSRWLHCNLVLSIPEWAEWAKKLTAKDVVTKKEVPVFDPMLIDYFQFNPKAFYELNVDVDDIELNNIPRTWHKGAIAVFQANQVRKAKNLPPLKPEEEEKLYAMAVGIAAAREFMGFVKLTREIDPRDIKYIWTDQKKAPMPSRLKSKRKGEEGVEGSYKSDIIGAVLYTAVKAVANKKLTFDEVKNFVDYLVRLNEPQWAMRAMTQLLDEHPYLTPGHESQLDPNHPEYDKEMIEATDYINDVFLEKYPGLFSENV